MSDIRVDTFQEALGRADEKCHLLCGNGFSMDWNPDYFSYSSLLAEAIVAERLSEELKQAFAVFETPDFEVVMRYLRAAALLAKVYEVDNPARAAAYEADAVRLRAILADTIASKHPTLPTAVSDDQYAFCHRFLSNFVCKYSVNYDLMLYWALMKAEGNLSCKDGFGEPEVEDAAYVEWDVSSGHDSDLFYLHGALHLYDAGQTLRKLTWKRDRTHRPLHDQILNSLQSGFYPLIVSEGHHEQKMERIVHHAYLARAMSSLSQRTGTLFVHGLALKKNDEHILKILGLGRLRRIMISIFGSPNSAENQATIESGLTLKRMRDEQNRQRQESRRRLKENGGRGGAHNLELEVGFYWAKSANIWGNHNPGSTE